MFVSCNGTVVTCETELNKPFAIPSMPSESGRWGRLMQFLSSEHIHGKAGICFEDHIVHFEHLTLVPVLIF